MTGVDAAGAAYAGEREELSVKADEIPWENLQEHFDPDEIEEIKAHRHGELEMLRAEGMWSTLTSLTVRFHVFFCQILRPVLSSN